MATKMCFIVNNETCFEEKIITFEYVKGLAFSQKQKNVLSFHSSIQKIYPNSKIIEISTKSNKKIGVALSAFNLKLDGYYIESIFQASKVFCDGEQYEFLKFLSPIEAKKFINSQEHKPLNSFRYNKIEFPLEPKSLFYDYIYIKALR